jgi:dipeptidyl aminopeptidase/acylaminoacyl peptidase
MSKRGTAACGSWKSPITADLIVSEAIGLGQIALDSGNIYWLESRPEEGGRNVIVLRSPEGIITDITPQPFNARTRVHEYGGGAFLVENSCVYFSNLADGRLYRQDPGGRPVPLTPEGDLRYADGVMDRSRRRIICIREDHTKTGVVNSLVGIGQNGDMAVRTLVSGNDFYSSPRLSPDSASLAWLTWNHPNMPWDSTELWLGRIADDGSVSQAERIAGGPAESICQPEFSSAGDLFFISDRTGWWNLYRWNGKRADAVWENEAEFGIPHWIFGTSQYGFESGGRIICSYIKDGISYLARVDPAAGLAEAIDIPFTSINFVKVTDGKAFFVAGSPSETAAIVKLDLESGKTEALRRSTDIAVAPDYVSIPEEIEFPTENGLTAHAFYYAPQNSDFTIPGGELPPLIVSSHGGPTSAASNILNLSIQYWTSRGFALVNVNYGGSSGYGRAYRRRLNGQWGVTDVDDCINAARYLIKKGAADPRRTAIRGGSAGGYTTLAALTFRSFFKAGASYYGVSDLEALEKDTHKFESRYQDILIGPYPERSDLFRARSPVNFVDQLSSPIIFFQGNEDKVVPPAQSELMADALRRKGIPVAYLLFEHEQHGLRQAKNIRRALEAELYFYSRIFGFKPAEEIEPVNIENLR